MNTAEKITNLLKEHNKEQQDLANYLGISPVTISEWKSGKTRSYRKHLNKIAEFLNVPLEYFESESNSNSNLECPCPDTTVAQLVEAYNDLSLSDKARALTYVCNLKDGSI
jgi:repressor LexA